MTQTHYCQSSELNIDSLKNKRSKVSIYLFNNKFYKGITFSDDTLIFDYNSQVNKCLYTSTKNKQRYCLDYSNNVGGEPNEIKIIKLDTLINGYRCNLLIMKYEKYTIKFYYTESLKINPEIFKNHIAFFYSKK